MWNDLSRALKKALEQLTRSRELEGAKLAKDLAARLGHIEKASARIKRRATGLTNDITEELVRLSSHTGAFRGTLKTGGEVGRKIDFIAQEMVREINTTGSKCNDSAIAADVIEVKTEIEKIREQAQNLE